MNAPEGRHRPLKRFGQHFLRDRAIIERIIDALDARPDDIVVEIGPGLGALTLPLLQRLPRLIAIEIDRGAIGELRKRAAGVAGNLELIEADVLAVDFAALAQGRKIKLVGNLPYNISTPILFHALARAEAIVDMHFMLQKEVVDRMAAAPDHKSYGRLSVMLQAYCAIESLFPVPPEAFDPPPKVDSAVVRAIPLPGMDLHNFEALSRVVRAAFAQRRKTLRNALRGMFAEKELIDAGVDPGVRAENVTVTQYLVLAERVAAAQGAARAPA